VSTTRVKEHHALYGELAAIVGSKYTTDADFALWAVSRDTSVMPEKIPGIIVRPGSTEEVSEIVRLANLTNTPVIPRGGGASLFGLPAGIPGRSLVIDLTRMDKIIEINEENMTVTAEGGITTSELGTKLIEKGYFANLAFMPYYADTLGGLLAGVYGAGAGHRLCTQGANHHDVVGLKVVLPTGDVIQTGGGPGTNVHQKTTYTRECGSPDMTGMFLADAGIFGIKTEATLLIYPHEKIFNSRSYLFDTFDDLWRALSTLQRIEPYPYTMMIGVDPKGATAMTGQPSTSWVLLNALKGYTEEEIAAKVKACAEVCKAAGGRPGTEVLNGLAAAANDGAMLAEMGRFASLGSWNFLESVVSTQEAPRLFMKFREIIDGHIKEHGLEKYGVTRVDLLFPVQHNYYYSSTDVFWMDNSPDARKKFLELADVYNHLVANEGAFPGVHQRHPVESMASNWSPTFYNYVRTLKRTLDPNNIMNPGQWRL
jgi:glycolate oxidase